MIMLIGCGHSFSGVRQVDFPLIVTEAVPTGIQTFTSTVEFGNALLNIMTAPLKMSSSGSNITTRSDSRIFSSDGNVTMQSVASPTTFNTVCADLFERMLNTVPSTVTLTDPIEPFDFKVSNTSCYSQGGSLAFFATLRVDLAVSCIWRHQCRTMEPAGEKIKFAANAAEVMERRRRERRNL
ncbi:hypothetical protein C8R45DRAFT_931887 [Mycena sanguinolenta]|nr:hypothetical protein C8R45DRAFT_931887 [Mycena sanguinolenta]